MRLAIVFGTRPEAIKLGPVVVELRSLGVEIDLVCTNQHTTLLSGTPADSDLAGAHSLDLPSDGNVWSWVETATDRLANYLHNADAVMVQGDTMTALAGARAAKRLGLPLHHVEAGLRSHNLHAPWPEELIRVEISQTATWHYAPTQTSRANLVLEGIPDEQIVVAGNSVVSALERYTPRSTCFPPLPKNTLLITMHRRESQHAFQGCVDAVAAWARKRSEYTILWPLHPSVALTHLALPANVIMGSPLSYWDMVSELCSTQGIATDSGGLQEEAATLGVPCAVLRTVSDRPESIEAGVARLFDPTPDGITEALDTLWARTIPRRASNCYGDIQSALRIAEATAKRLTVERGTAPILSQFV